MESHPVCTSLCVWRLSLSATCSRPLGAAVSEARSGYGRVALHVDTDLFHTSPILSPPWSCAVTLIFYAQKRKVLWLVPVLVTWCVFISLRILETPNASGTEGHPHSGLGGPGGAPNAWGMGRSMLTSASFCTDVTLYANECHLQRPGRGLCKQNHCRFPEGNDDDFVVCVLTISGDTWGAESPFYS